MPLQFGRHVRLLMAGRIAYSGRQASRRRAGWLAGGYIGVPLLPPVAKSHNYLRITGQNGDGGEEEGKEGER